jgi:hypothetical protein
MPTIEVIASACETGWRVNSLYNWISVKFAHYDKNDEDGILYDLPLRTATQIRPNSSPGANLTSLSPQMLRA